MQCMGPNTIACKVIIYLRSQSVLVVCQLKLVYHRPLILHVLEREHVFHDIVVLKMHLPISHKVRKQSQIVS